MEHMKLAFSYYGLKEIKGKADNAEITGFFDELGFDGKKMKDETAWCSAYANIVAKYSNLEYSGALNARSWLTIGEDVDFPEYGDVVVFWRESKESWKGHVAFYINDDADYVYVLGGNQGNQVCIKAYPKSRVLKYRRLT